MSDLPITPETALWLVLTSQIDDLDPDKVLNKLSALVTAYLNASGRQAPAMPAVPPAPDAVDPSPIYVAKMVALMDVTGRGIVTLRSEYREMATASNAAITAKLAAITSLQSLGPLSGDNAWSKAITGIGGAGLLTAMQSKATQDIVGTASKAGVISGWAVGGAVLAMVTLQVIVWIATASLSAAAQRGQAANDQEIWREIVRQKLNAACLVFLDAGVREAQAVSPGYKIDDPGSVVKEALALSNPGICIAPDLSKENRDKTWALDRRQGGVLDQLAQRKRARAATQPQSGNASIS